jgi:hypothetical protein
MGNLIEKAIRKHAMRLCMRKRDWTREELTQFPPKISRNAGHS